MANPSLLRCDVLRTSVTCYVCGFTYAFTTYQIYIIQNPIKIRYPYVAMILLLVIKLWHHLVFFFGFAGATTPGPVPPERHETDSEDGRRWHYRTEGETAETLVELA